MSQPTFFEKLWERKVPQLLGTYLAVGFGVLQFVEFISKRFSLSNFWVDSYLLLWLLLLPAVALLLYYKGLPTKTGKGLNWKKWAVFGNIGLALLLVLLVPGSAAPAVTETVTTTDKDGATVSRVIPSAAAVKRIAVFQLSNREEDEANDWWGVAYSLLLNDNLKQRPELIAFEALSLNRVYARYDVEPFAHINIGLQRKIAQRARADYFVSAEYKAGSDSHEVSGGLYRSRDGKLVQTLETIAPSAFMVVDQLKDQINGFLPPPVIVDQMTTQLPASALITDQEKALEAYVKGAIKFAVDPGDLPASLRLFKQSLELDPSCAPCAYSTGDKLYGLGKVDSARIFINKATRLAEVLPEREQFSYKATLMTVSGNTEGFYPLMEAFRSLYPYEYYPYSALEDHYYRDYGLDSAIVLMERAAELSDRERALGRLYELYVRAEDYDKVEGIIKDMEQEFPDQDKTLRRYASFYQTTGQMEKARKTLREMQALDPLNSDITSHIIFSEIRAGNYAEAEGLSNKALAQATNIVDSTKAWNYLIQSYSGRGQFKRATKELLAYEDLISKTSPRNVIVFNNFMTKSEYVLKQGRFDLVDSLLQEVATYDANRAEIFRCYIPIQAALDGLKPPFGNFILEGCEVPLRGYGASLSDLMGLAKFMIAEDYSAAAAFLDELQASGRDGAPALAKARIYRLAGAHEKALKLLNKDLVAEMNNPILLLQLALTHHAMGNTSAAKEALERPLETWNAADPEFIMGQQAKALANELGLPVS